MQALKKILGPFPQKTQLDLVTIDIADCGSYLQKKVNFRTEIDDLIPAFLLIPKKPGKRAAIYAHHQHAGNWKLGKSEIVGLGGDPSMAYGKELAERGFVVLAPDALTFEERNRTNYSGSHNLYELTSRLIKGQTLFSKVMHDVSIGIDLLESLPNVDPTRIGFIGHSYGGRMAIWAPAFDSRIVASVSNCGCVSYKDSLDPSIGIQMEFCIPDIQGKFDTADIAKFIAPRSLFISATDNDKWSVGANVLYEECVTVFPEGNFELKIYPGKHEFSREMRANAYDFLERKLINIQA